MAFIDFGTSQEVNFSARDKAARLKAFCWRKGVSGNPGGRPKKRPVSEEYPSMLATELPAKIRRQLRLPEGATWGLAIAMGIALSAAKGNHGAAKEIREAIEGKAAQRLELVGSDGGPIRMKAEDLVARIKEIYGLNTPTD